MTPRPTSSLAPPAGTPAGSRGRSSPSSVVSLSSRSDRPPPHCRSKRYSPRNGTSERSRDSGRDRKWHARAMELRSIGSLKVSAVGIGCNNFGMRIDREQTEAVVRAALDAGVNLFDTADVYGGTRSEEYLGRALAGRRDEAIIATKFGAQIDEDHKGASAAYIRERRRGQPAPARHRSHRPLPAARARQHGADRRDARRARRAGARRARCGRSARATSPPR